MMWTASPERHQVPRRDRCRSRIGKPSMRTFIRIGIDLAKNFFQVHAIEREGEPAVTRKLSRGKVLAFFAQAAPCRVGMEACGSSHYWAREIRALGHDVVLIPPAYTKPYVKRGKNVRTTRRRSARPCRAPTCCSCRSRARISKRC